MFIGLVTFRRVTSDTLGSCRRIPSGRWVGGAGRGRSRASTKAMCQKAMLSSFESGCSWCYRISLSAHLMESSYARAKINMLHSLHLKILYATLLTPTLIIKRLHSSKSNICCKKTDRRLRGEKSGDSIFEAHRLCLETYCWCFCHYSREYLPL